MATLWPVASNRATSETRYIVTLTCVSADRSTSNDVYYSVLERHPASGIPVRFDHVVYNLFTMPRSLHPDGQEVDPSVATLYKGAIMHSSGYEVLHCYTWESDDGKFVENFNTIVKIHAGLPGLAKGTLIPMRHLEIRPLYPTNDGFYGSSDRKELGRPVDMLEPMKKYLRRTTHFQVTLCSSPRICDQPIEKLYDKNGTPAIPVIYLSLVGRPKLPRGAVPKDSVVSTAALLRFGIDKEKDPNTTTVDPRTLLMEQEQELDRKPAAKKTAPTQAAAFKPPRPTGPPPPQQQQQQQPQLSGPKPPPPPGSRPPLPVDKTVVAAPQQQPPPPLVNEGASPAASATLATPTNANTGATNATDFTTPPPRHAGAPEGQSKSSSPKKGLSPKKMYDAAKQTMASIGKSQSSPPNVIERVYPDGPDDVMYIGKTRVDNGAYQWLKKICRHFALEYKASKTDAEKGDVARKVFDLFHGCPVKDTSDGLDAHSGRILVQDVTTDGTKTWVEMKADDALTKIKGILSRAIPID